MKRTFQSSEWGEVVIEEHRYTSDGSLAIELTTTLGEPIARLSVNMTPKQPLPKNCFYMKDWSENERIAGEAMHSGWFKIRLDLEPAFSGFISADAYELLDVRVGS